MAKSRRFSHPSQAAKAITIKRARSRLETQTCASKLSASLPYTGLQLPAVLFAVCDSSWTRYIAIDLNLPCVALRSPLQASTALTATQLGQAPRPRAFASSNRGHDWADVLCHSTLREGEPAFAATTQRIDPATFLHTTLGARLLRRRHHGFEHDLRSDDSTHTSADNY